MNGQLNSSSSEGGPAAHRNGHLGAKLTGLIEATLDDCERDRVLVHLASCDSCREDAVALRILKRRMKALGEAAADSALTRNLILLTAQENSRFAEPNRESVVARRMTKAAAWLAGRRRAHILDAWRSDLFAPDGSFIPFRQQLRHASGYWIAVVQFRLVNDIGAWLGGLLNRVLASNGLTRSALAAVFAIPVAMIIGREGFYGLITNAEQLGVIAGALGAGTHWLRKWRGVKPPKKKVETPGSQ